MSAKNNFRSSDLGAILTSGTTGFAVRKRTGVGRLVHMVLLASMVVLGASLLVYYESPEGCALAIAIGICFAFISQNIEKMNSLKKSQEFISALFSSALGKGYQFCCIVKSTGEIVFYNRPFQSVFPAYMAQDNRTLETLLNIYSVPQEHREKINSLIAANAEGSVSTVVREASATNGLSLTLYVEPIDRPTGFFLLRGK